MIYVIISRLNITYVVKNDPYVPPYVFLNVKFSIKAQTCKKLLFAIIISCFKARDATRGASRRPNFCKIPQLLKFFSH